MTSQFTPTEFARRYNILPQEEDIWKLFYPHGKSGFTPTDPINIIPKTTTETQNIVAIEKAQTEFLYGSSARELTALGVYPDATSDFPILTNPIQKNETNRRNQWYPNRPILDIVASGNSYSLPPNPGKWMAGNPFVDQILDPCLRLASRILQSSYILDRMDAFFFGEYRDIPSHLDNRPSSYKLRDGILQTYHRRKPQDTNQAQAKALLDKVLGLLESKVSWGIGDGNCGLDTRNVPAANGFSWLGITQVWQPIASSPSPHVEISLAWQILQPLLRNDLPASERLCMQWFIATDIIHEVMHAIHGAVLCELPGNKLKTAVEPYFENEVYSEMGRSFEFAFWGGVVWPLWEAKSYHKLPYAGPLLAFAVCGYPNRRENELDESRPILGGTGVVDPDIYWAPIVSKYYEQIYRDEYWDNGVSKLGIQMVRPGTAFLRVIKYSGQGPTAKKVSYQDIRGGFESPWTQQYEHAVRIGALNQMTPAQKVEVALLAKMTEEHLTALRIRDFAQNRSWVAGQIRTQLHHIEVAESFDEPEKVNPRQRVLYELFAKELEEQSKELVNFAGKARLHNLRYRGEQNRLIRLNRRLRKLLKEMIERAEKYKDEERRMAAALLARYAFAIMKLLTGRMQLGSLSAEKWLLNMHIENRATLTRVAVNRGFLERLHNGEDIIDEDEDAVTEMRNARLLMTSEKDPSVEVLETTGFDLMCNLDTEQERKSELNIVIGKYLLWKTLPDHEKARAVWDIREKLIRIQNRVDMAYRLVSAERLGEMEAMEVEKVKREVESDMRFINGWRVSMDNDVMAWPLDPDIEMKDVGKDVEEFKTVGGGRWRVATSH